ncbi:DUF1127 domain-containing protein [Pseudomonas sp. BMS12]|uniref:DUF1127 domain-containing protein n=1 Tax=Pseudomonas sp. BMS12 TaxID=1796033 RepID=UPI00083B3A90|nr:DUF1127 domain-containing protein [Pseudomonas sp. BMS12]
MKGQKGFAIAHSISLDGLHWPRLRWWQRLQRGLQLARERRQLAMLDDAALKDMGLTRGDVMQESERSFWDDPLQR